MNKQQQRGREWTVEEQEGLKAIFARFFAEADLEEKIAFLLVREGCVGRA